MSKLSLQQFAGMVTAPGLLERNPASCLEALNWEFPAPGVIRKRRGFQRLAENLGAASWKLLTSRLMGDNVLSHHGTAGATTLAYGDGVAAWATISTIDASNVVRPLDTRMQMAVSQRNHYLTADEGVVRLESDFITASSSARYAGMPRGLGPATWSLIAGTNLGNGYARAYRVTWHRKDADGIEMGGAPTSRFVVANAVYNTGYTGGTRHVDLTIQIPNEWGTVADGLTTEYYWRLWGTVGYLEASELGNDEMHLLTEAYLTAGNIAAGVVTYVDQTPDAFLLASPTLHTNSINYPAADAGLLQGVANEDAPPPNCNDVAYWQDCMWYADCQSRASITVGCISALADGDTVTITSNGVATVLTAKLVPAAATDFLIVTTGATTAINIRQTMVHLCRAFNQAVYSAAGVGASLHPVMTTSTQPGLIFLEATRPLTTALIFNSSALAKWTGFNGYSIPSNVVPESRSNQLWFSKPLRADAVPPVNSLSVGPADSRILRIAPFRDRLLVFTDYGIFQVTGRTFADFGVYPFDLGYRLMGRDYVAECDQKIYAWCNEGVIEIDDGGVTVVSQNIEPSIEAALVTAGASDLQAGRAIFGELGFAVAYRNQHQVRFHYPEIDNPTLVNGCAYWFSFDTRTRTWARGRFTAKTNDGYYQSRTCGVVRFTDDLIAFGNWLGAGDSYLFLERRAYVAADFTDDGNSGSPDATFSQLRFQYQVPDAEGAQHWQQTVINWDAEEISWRTKPTSIVAAHVTEAVAPTAQTIAVSELATRVEPPQDARRGQRLYVELTHEVAEYAGIVGLTQEYRGGSRFARKVTP